MEDPLKSEPNVKKHLGSLHKRIQHKYIEMQKKLEKSKSVDSISNLSDEFVTQEYSYGSMDDLRELDAVFIQSEKMQEAHAYVVEDFYRQSSVSRDVELVEASFAVIEEENKRTSINWEREDIESMIFPTNNSLESLNEIGKESDDSWRQPSPSPPRTIRQRIKAARDRRREEKERQSQIKKEKMEKLILSNTKQDTKPSRKSKVATVTIGLIEATGLESLSDGKERLLFCRYRMGHEKGKSKVVKSGASVVKWQELFNINMFDEHILELSCFDKHIFLGRDIIDLSELEKETTHKLKLELHGGETSGVKLFVLLTITGISLLNSIIEMDDFEKAELSKALPKSGQDVGSLSVIVYGAKGLSGHDCYCALKLANDRQQTHTEYKTPDPNWMKLFRFNLSDITSILEITIVEEKKGEEVGKISVPLLRIHNGEKVWYALKDTTQRDRAKGNNPRILLEMRTSWNILKASLRVINPKETDLLDSGNKLDRRLFTRNLSRSKAVINWTLDAFRVIKMCFEWESRKRNLIALIAWIIFCYFFKIWMFPLLLLIPFIKYRPENYVLINYIFQKKVSANEIENLEKEEKSTLRQKINSLAEMVQSVQNGIGKVASLGESIKNLCNFTVPYLSLLAVFFILVITFIMFIIPLKYIFIIWGIHKFTRKILRPNRIPNSEILDLLSRVPDDEVLLDCEELPLDLEAEEVEIKKQ